MDFPEAPPGSRLVLSTPAGDRSVDLYSEEGRQLLVTLWTKVAVQNRVVYEPSWLGIPVIQFPEDMVAIQELLWRLRPDVVVECGIAHGGSLVMCASILELIGHGQVIGVDIEIRKYNRVAIEAHPMTHRIHLIEGSSADPATFAAVEAACSGAKRIVVMLDSNHSAAHVAAEIALYSRLVTPGSYLVVMDGAQAMVWDIPRGKAEWRDDHPLVAIDAFLARSKDYVVDHHWTRFGITSSPMGFLRRLTAEETAHKQEAAR